jgi:hypothetical protein
VIVVNWEARSRRSVHKFWRVACEIKKKKRMIVIMTKEDQKIYLMVARLFAVVAISFCAPVPCLKRK